MVRGVLPTKRAGSRLGFALIILAGLVSHISASEDPRIAPQFLDALRERGYYDLAIDELNALRTQPGLSADLKVGLDYEEGKTLLEESSRTGDLVRRKELLDQSRTKLEKFTKDHADLPAAREAYIQIARMMVERGHLAMILSDEAKDAAEKDAKIAEARAAFILARDAYDQAVNKLDKEYGTFPKSIPENDPRWAERNRVHSSLLDAMLQRAEVEYEQAQTFPEKAPERKKLLDAALAQFETLNKNYRETLAGLTAQMWQAKCFEEQGKIDEAVGLYKTLLSHTDPHPQLRMLQAHVGSFYIAALSKRKYYALAADEAVRWLETFNRPEERRSEQGLRVYYELAKNIDLQMPEVEEADKPRASKRVVDALTQAVRYASPFKQSALALLKKYKPSAAVKAEEIAKLTYEEAMSQGEEALNAQEWERAIALLNAASRKAEAANSVDKLNASRYNLAYAYLMNKQYYEANVIADHLARRHPKAGNAPKATIIGMAALTEAYLNYREVDRASDLDRLIDLARYTAETWPDRDEADDARMNIGKIKLGTGHYAEAIAAFSSVRKSSPHQADAQTQLGITHWSEGRNLERKGDKAGAEAETARAIEFLGNALKSRQEASVPPTDPSLVNNACELSFVLTETGKATEALAVLEPVARAQTIKTGPTYATLLESLLRARIAANQVDQAIALMQELEKTGGTSARQAQNYYRLGQLIKKELGRLRQQKNTAAEAGMLKAYRTFLVSLADSKSGQTYESLDWAAANLIEIGSEAEAEPLLHRMLSELTVASSNLEPDVIRRRSLQIRLKLAKSLRGQGKFDEADTLVKTLKAEEPNQVDPLLEEGLLLEARAEARQGAWLASYQYWQKLALRLGRIRPRPVVYYDAWYHAAYALNEDQKGTLARQTLAGVMKLSPGVGSPEMKAKYDQLLARIK